MKESFNKKLKVSDRQKFAERNIYLVSDVQRNTVLALVNNLPLDAYNPLEIVVREKVKGRKLSQQALLFAGPMTDIANQAWFEGKQYSVEVLHHLCKREFLPEEFDPELCKEGYSKWQVDPLGERVLVGSTTELTIKGYSEYIEAVHAFGASYGVNFTANPNEVRA